MKHRWPAALVLIGASGCGSSGHLGANAPRDAGPIDAMQDREAAEDGGGRCGVVSAGFLPPGAGAATGTVVGAGLNADVCQNGVWARVQQGIGADRFPFSVVLGFTGGDNTSPDFAFQSPPAATEGELNGFVGIDSLDGGTYVSSGGQTCGSVTFAYYMPAAPAPDCSGGTPTTCPAGCGRVCPASGCDGVPCVPTAQYFSYSAHGTSGCLGDGGAQVPLGSWQLTLTSVEAVSGGLTPHGSFGATLIDSDGGAASAMLTLDF